MRSGLALLIRGHHGRCLSTLSLIRKLCLWFVAGLRMESARVCVGAVLVGGLRPTSYNPCTAKTPKKHDLGHSHVALSF